MAAPSNTELAKEPTCHFPSDSPTSLPVAFPRGRYINLDDHDEFTLYSSYQPIDQPMYQFKKEPLLPITLSVNKESREETSKHYIIAFLALSTGATFRQRTFCYNMSLDVAFLGDITPWHPEIVSYCPFAELEPEAPQVFTATKMLRFPHWLTVFYDLAYVFERNPEGCLEIHHILHAGSYSEGSNDGLFRFTGLEKLRLVLPEWAKKDYQLLLELAETFKEQMIAFLQENAEVWGGNVPVVMIEEWVGLEKL